MSPHFRSRIHNIQLLILAKYISVAEFVIDNILKLAIEDIRKLESVSYLSSCCDLYMHYVFSEKYNAILYQS